MLQRTAYENMISGAISLGFRSFLLFFASLNAGKINILPPHTPIFLDENKATNQICRRAWGHPDKTLLYKENSGQGVEKKIQVWKGSTNGYSPKVMPHLVPQFSLD